MDALIITIILLTGFVTGISIGIIIGIIISTNIYLIPIILIAAILFSLNEAIKISHDQSLQLTLIYIEMFRIGLTLGFPIGLLIGISGLLNYLITLVNAYISIICIL